MALDLSTGGSQQSLCHHVPVTQTQLTEPAVLGPGRIPYSRKLHQALDGKTLPKKGLCSAPRSQLFFQTLEPLQLGEGKKDLI